MFVPNFVVSYKHSASLVLMERSDASIAECHYHCIFDRHPPEVLIAIWCSCCTQMMMRWVVAPLSATCAIVRRMARTRIQHRASCEATTVVAVVPVEIVDLEVVVVLVVELADMMCIVEYLYLKRIVVETPQL